MYENIKCDVHHIFNAMEYTIFAKNKFVFFDESEMRQENLAENNGNCAAISKNYGIKSRIRNSRSL